MATTTTTMTLTEVQNLPSVMDFGTACRFLGITRRSGNLLVESERFPVKVLRLGRTYRVSTVALLEAVGHPIPEGFRSAA
jgi:hypothetical protein